MPRERLSGSAGRIPIRCMSCSMPSMRTIAMSRTRQIQMSIGSSVSKHTAYSQVAITTVKIGRYLQAGKWARAIPARGVGILGYLCPS